VQNIKIIPIAGVPSSQALPGYLITAPPSVCNPDIIGVLAVWIQNQKIKNKCELVYLNQSLIAERLGMHEFFLFSFRVGHS